MKRPEAKEWWQSKDDADRVYICGFDHQGDPVYSHAEGAYVDTIEMNYFLDGYEHLPDCTGWDWEPPESFPQYWVPTEETVSQHHLHKGEIAYYRHDDPKSGETVLVNGQRFKFTSIAESSKVQVTEAEAKARVTLPAPSPHRPVTRVTMHRIMIQEPDGEWYQIIRSNVPEWRSDRWHIVESFEVEVPA